MKLNKQKIIKTIRQMHRRGEALNISAVKRRHPELMRAVYAIKPFWGWRKALEDAGISYSEIKVELLGKNGVKPLRPCSGQANFNT